MTKTEIIIQLKEFQNIFRREQEIKSLYSTEVEKMSKTRHEIESLREEQQKKEISIREINKNLNIHIGKKDEIEKRIRILEEGREKIKVARQIKSWEKEMENQHSEHGLIETNIIYEQDNLNKLNQELDRIRARIEDLEIRNQELNDKIESIKGENQDEMNKIQESKKKIRNLFDIQFIDNFETLLGKTNGTALVTVDGDACSGCYTILPLYLQGELGEELEPEQIEIHQCPNCFRYLYYEEWLEQ